MLDQTIDSLVLTNLGPEAQKRLDEAVKSHSNLASITNLYEWSQENYSDIWTADQIKPDGPLSERGLEQLIKRLYDEQGYDSTLTPQTRDKGADVIIQKDGYTGLIEVKQYTSDKVSVGEIKDIHSLSVNPDELPGVDSVDDIIFICTTDYTGPAIKKAESIHQNEPRNVRLLTGEEVAFLLNRYDVSLENMEQD